MTDRRLALVVAVDSYDHAALHRLAAPAADADALAGVLGDPALGAFEVDILHNPTSWATCERVEQLLADRHPTDLVLLHFSCHGLKDNSGELYLAATNTRPDLLGSTAIDAAWVNRMMQRSRAQRVVLLLDCCYGGAFERGVVARAAGPVDVGDQFRQPGRGRVVITASTAMEYSFEGAQLAGGEATPSVFTGALVEGIRTGDADRDQDGNVALGELYDYVYDRVRELTPYQTPSKWEFGLRGDLFVARNPNRRPRPVEPPSSPAKEAQPPRAADAPARPGASIATRSRPQEVVRAPDEAAKAVVPPAEPSKATAAAAAAVAAPEGTAAVAPKKTTAAAPEGTAAAATAGIAGLRRRRLAVIAGAILVVAGLVTGTVLWVEHSGSGETGAGGSKSAAQRTYQDLLAMLPTTIRASCVEQPNSNGSVANAQCGPGQYMLWGTKTAMDNELGLAAARSGSCSETPTGSTRRRAETGSGTVICDLLDPSPRYCVEWGITSNLMTGTFFATESAAYRGTYDRAMAALGQLT